MAEEIVIKINVSSGEAKRKIDDTKKSTDSLGKSVSRLSKAEKELAFQRSEDGKELAKLNILIREEKIANLESAAAKLKSADASRKFKTQSGLQNAILLETGRLASDVGFGFTAIANNLAQLISLTSSFVNTTGSLKQSMKELGKSIMGTGGVLLAVQLFIGVMASPKVQDFIGSLFGAAEAVKKLKKALSEATDVYGAQIGKLTTLTRLLEDKRLNDTQRSQVLKEIKKDNEDLNVVLDESGKITEESNARIQRKIDLLKIQAQTQALVKAIEQETVELLKIQNSSLADNVDFFDTLGALLSNLGNKYKAVDDAIVKGEQVKQKELASTQGVIDKLYEELVKVVNFGDDSDSKKGQRRVRQFKQQLLDLSKTILNYNKQAEAILGRSAQEQLDVDEEFAKKEADRRLKSFEERQAQRLEEYKEQVKGQKNANKLIKNAEAEFNESMADAKLEHQELLLSIDDAFITQRILLKEKEAQALAKVERQIENTEMQRLKQAEGVNEIFYAKREEQLSSDLFLTQARAADTTLTEQQRAEATLQVLNIEDQQRQLVQQRELDRVEQRKNVNMEYVGFTQGISSLLSTIAGENEAMQNAALVVEKGAAIADVVIKAQSSVATRTAAEAAVPAFLPGGVPNPVKPVSMAATKKANVRTKVSAGIAIANIIATTLTSFKKPDAGAGVASGGVQAPAFNVVGASPIDQLANVVGDMSAKPEVFLSLNEIDRGLKDLKGLDVGSQVFSGS
jgi:hypothetical protein